MPTVILIVYGLLNGQLVYSQHEFVYRGDCDRTRTIVLHDLHAKGATNLSAYCLDESAT